uniref:Heat shock protein DnaJ n=2 Tax=Solanum tuberosum TaxID=4113 RepID=M1AEN6_SOLTU
MHPKITEADIDKFEANYRGSESERTDLIDLYKKYKGKMKRLFCSMICSDVKLDSHRFKDILDEAIAAGEIKSTKAYEKWAKEVSETKPPTSPLKRRQKSKKEPDDLFAIISQRQNERRGKMNSMFSSLASKYGGDPSATEPSEEEFEAARIRLEAMTETSAQELGLAPAPAPDAGAAFSLPSSGVLVGTSLILCVAAIFRH